MRLPLRAPHFTAVNTRVVCTPPGSILVCMLLRGLACTGYFKPGLCCTASDKVVALVTLCLRLHHLHLPVVSELSGAGTLRQLYRRAMQMEVDFFSAQPGISSAPSVGMLVVDFDDTCTATDTTSQVFNAAIAANAENAPGGAGPRKTTHAFCTSCPGQSQQRGNCNAGSSMHLKYEYRLRCPLE